ncbi:hypothetical protein [uncultured Bacteroides sp.]|uniref:hypothetical protein n=1 Tax=uncultured Bacteroides sp. TaxID=162156 RepID=UPI00259BD412|nr:hypothetical protein [uncultured Bacteroides sp.]
MHRAIEEFIIRRINDHNMAEPEVLQELFQQFNGCVEALRAALPIELHGLLRQCEDAYALLDGETINAYYRAGFSDSVAFLFAWQDGK